MQIFEFHFNPKKKGISLNSFCYDNETKSNNKGFLYMAGELLDTIPGSEQFINNLAKAVKEEYYSEFYISIEQSIKKALSRANDFLSCQIAKNNVRWLGNFNFAIVNINNKKNINISKIGNIKIILSKDNDLIDITKKIDADSEDVQKGYYSPKAFTKITTGKIKNNDKILIITKELFDIFEKELILRKIIYKDYLDQKIIESVLNNYKDKVLKTSGVFLLIDNTKDKKTQEVDSKKQVSTEEELEFSLKDIFKPLIKKRFSLINQNKKRIKKNKEKVKPEKRIKLGKLKLKLTLSEKNKKPTYLILVLIATLIIGLMVFQREDFRSKRFVGADLETVIQEIEKADLFISQNKKQDAFNTLQDIWFNINPNESNKEILEAKKQIEEKLLQLSNLSVIDEPELIYEFLPRDLAPQRLIFYRNNLYFFTPFSNKIVVLNLINNESKELFLPIEREVGASSARIINNNLVFFVKPNRLFVLQNQEFKLLASLKEPKTDYDFNHFSNFYTSLYFWNSKDKEIIRYVGYNNNPEKWFSAQTKKPTDIQSMSVDGSIWIVDSDNSILRYSGGNLTQEISLSVFPWHRKISQIFVSPSFYRVFFLEPAENRVIITDKRGNLIRQITSDKFNNLVHFSISSNANELYILNNLFVYKINL